ncbi:hypothetical protein [Lacticaseibacillus kribbianus]|uniref:hypothetical protein n=1 Tax=Lacticaseibacillus kribbianus TaxID=2926292 RepID=UPI001CD471DB|nr:hypothetical protein [Lacticaseibacillus kribbianus]
MSDIPTRKAFREAQAKAESQAEERDVKRRQVERDYAKEQEKRKKPVPGRFDSVTYTKVNSLKKKLNWAIGIVIVLLIIVAVVLFKL